MANRRMGGMGGPRGNRNFPQPFQGGGVNPWQGPPNPMSQGLISQLSSNPQQLALALTSLLQPQQSMNNPPSLLSLNTGHGFPGQNRDFNRFGRGRDIRRHEPYNKNRNGFRSDGRRQNQQQNKKAAPKDNKKNEKETEAKQDASESTDEANEKKRDWKDEKNTSDEKKVEDTKESGDKDGPYHGVPVKFLHCFVCNKAMWDGESMHKHVKGLAHREMLDKLEESIHISVNILRENMRLAEERKVIEIFRQQRIQKKQRMMDAESHCNMCELKFMGKIVIHRKTEGHQRLKRYLHPNCKMCDKEFPSRIEWIEHRLTPEHLRKLNEVLNDKIGGAEGDKIIEDENEINLQAVLEEPLQMEAENAILELTDDLPQNLNLPAYKPNREIGTKCLKIFSGYRCELCKRSFHTEELAHMHLKSQMHYYNFIDAVKFKHKKDKGQQKKKEANDTKVKEEKADMYDPEEACNEAETEDQTMATADEGDPSVVDVEMSEQKEEVNEEEEEEEEEEAKKEIKEEKKPAVKPAPATPARPVRVGAVKNGAGPKSKKQPVRK